MAAPYSEKNAVLEEILREWGAHVPGEDNGYFTNWPEFLQTELKKRGYWVGLLPLWGPK